jgi:hypothetical protein
MSICISFADADGNSWRVSVEFLAGRRNDNSLPGETERTQSRETHKTVEQEIDSQIEFWRRGREDIELEPLT